MYSIDLITIKNKTHNSLVSNIYSGMHIYRFSSHLDVSEVNSDKAQSGEIENTDLPSYFHKGKNIGKN